MNQASRPPADDLVLGLDIGGTKLAAGVVAGDGQVLSMRVAGSHRNEGPGAMIARLVDLGRAAVSESGVDWSRIRAVGIACGGPLDPDAGIIQSALHLPGWDNVPIVRMVAEALDRPAVVDNDATACALAEWRFGAGRSRGADHLVYLTISTGVGGGLILDGRVYRGAALNAGELGHLTVEYRGRLCGCGRRGCLEAYVSGTNIALRAREALATGEPSSLGSLSEVWAEDVAAAALEGDPVAVRVWDETTAMLGSAVTSILDIFNPQVVVLGGGVTRAGDQLLRPVRDIALRQALGPAAAVADVVLAELGEKLAVVSAAAVAFDRLPTRRTDNGAGLAHE
ncbi:MAG: glucokinase [Chloroflexota bacterium]|jgi:glucokinase|nr:glucokinase [Chloroflexota bacterium]